MRAPHFILALLIALLLAVPYAAYTQGIEDATVLTQQADELIKQGRLLDAVPLVQRVLALREKALGSDHLDVAAAQYTLASVYLELGRYGDAEPLLKRSLAINEKAYGPDHPIVTTVTNRIAELYRRQGRYSDAEPLYKLSLEIQEKVFGPDHPYVGNLLGTLAILYREQGRYGEAEQLFKRSLAISENAHGQDHPDIAPLLNNFAWLYVDQGRYADAELLLQRALKLVETTLNPDHLFVALSLDQIASIYQIEGRYTDAEALHKRTLAVLEKALGPDNPYVADSLYDLAEVYRLQGRYGDAEPLYKRSLAIREKVLGPDHHYVAQSLAKLADLYKEQGRYVEAEPRYKSSITIFEKTLGPDHPHTALSLDSLAELYREQGRSADAEALYKRSLAISEKTFGPDHLNVATGLNNLALLYEMDGRYADAEPLFKRSLAILEKTVGPDHPDVAASLTNLADLYRNQGRYPEAETLCKRSLAIFEKAFGPDHPRVAVALRIQAYINYAQGRYDAAESLYKQALATDERVASPIDVVADDLNNLAAFYIYQGRYADALPIVKRTISVKEAPKDGALAVLYGAQSQSLISPNEGFDASFSVWQRSFSSAAGKAVSMLAIRFAAESNELAKLVREDQDFTAETDRLDKNLLAAMSKPPAERNAIAEEQTRKRIDQIRLDHDRLQDILNKHFPDYVALSKPQPLSVQETQALLADDEALISIDLDKTSYIWVVTNDRADWRTLSISAAEVTKAVKALRAALDPDSTKPFDTNFAHQLYLQVLGPIEDLISKKTRLSFVLSGALTSLPPQVLITGDPTGRKLQDVDWLVRNYAISVLPSVGSLKILRSGKSIAVASKPMIGFGDPVFDRSAQTAPKQKLASLNRSLPEFYRGAIADAKSLAQALPPLPETADELRAVGKQLGAKPEEIKLGDAASVTNVKHAPLDNYRVVYFATHALVAGEVEKFARVQAEPALVLSIPEKPTEDDDGLLRASDVAMLKMNADFVVLSACNTAAGDKPGAEALSGLARAFFYAGARSLVVSNWEVDSESTVALMTGLFEALKSNPHLSHAEALRLSMLQMIDDPSKPEWVQPKYWAPFIVVGEPQKS